MFARNDDLDRPRQRIQSERAARIIVWSRASHNTSTQGMSPVEAKTHGDP